MLTQFPIPIVNIFNGKYMMLSPQFNYQFNYYKILVLYRSNITMGMSNRLAALRSLRTLCEKFW